MKCRYTLDKLEFSLLADTICGDCTMLSGDFVSKLSDNTRGEILQTLIKKKLAHSTEREIIIDGALAECFSQLSKAKYAAVSGDRKSWVYYCISAVVILQENPDGTLRINSFSNVPAADEHMQKRKIKTEFLLNF